MNLELEDVGGGDQAFLTDEDTPINEFVKGGKGGKGKINFNPPSKTQTSAAAASLTPEQLKIKQTIEKMEREGLSFTSLFDALRT